MAAGVEARPGVSVKDLLDAGLHFGHQTKRWNPKMKRYIFDKRNGIHIIDLTKSAVMLEQAMQFVYDTAVTGRRILFVGTKKQAQQVIKDAAVSGGQPYVTQRWLGGTLTNSITIRRSVKRMRDLQALEKKDAFATMHKKEASVLRHELEKLSRNLSGVADMSELPGALFVVDIAREAIAVKEANKLKIPVVAIVDTNCDPDPIDYVIPGNDDAIRAIKLVATAVAETVRRGADEYAKVAAEDTVLGRKCWVIELTAKAPDVSYNSRRIWVDKERYVPMREHRFAKSGKLLKTTEVKSVSQHQGRWVADRAVFKDALRTGEGTEFVLDSIRLNVSIPDYIFSKAALKK